MLNRAAVAGALVAVAGPLALAGCWSAPTGPDADGGAQVTPAGELRFWLGAPCDGVAAVRVVLEDPDDRTIGEWSLTAGDPAGASLTELTVGDVPAGFTETTPLDVPWQRADVVSFRLTGPDDESVARDFVVVESLLEDAGDHEGEWYLQDRGWYTQDEYRALAAEMVHPYCAPHHG